MIGRGPRKQLRQIAIDRTAGADHAEVLDVLARLTEQYGSARNAAVQLIRSHPEFLAAKCGKRGAGSGRRARVPATQ